MRDLGRWLDPGHGNRDELIVVLHGYARADTQMAAVRETIRDARPNADIFAPELPYAKNSLCKQKAESIVAELVSDIDRLVSKHRRSGGKYEEISFVGHSFGAVLARKIAIVAFGEQVNATGNVPAPFEHELQKFRSRRSWASSIRRIVLLAGMNRGWTVSSAMDWITTVWWSILQLYGEVVLRGRPTAFAIRRGAPFLVQTRLQWIALMDPKYGPKPDIVVVQLLGASDDQVSPDDNVDYSVDLYGAKRRQSYFYIEVGMSGHGNVIEMSKSGTPDTKKERSGRREKFLWALEGSRKKLAQKCITREQMADNLPPEPDASVTDMVFVVHGIRDKGFWTQKIARNIKRHASRKQKFESLTASYGYFAMLPFMLRTVRQRKVEWLMDCYVEARARYPRANFHYVGHSNGTYLAAQALADYPAARFKHVVFAGSVVRRDYDWLSLIRRKSGRSPRVTKVLNYVATKDWVVALFPKGVQQWKRFNLGSAGHDGFIQARKKGPVHEIAYIVGSHGAGHEEPNWNNIARFIVRGVVPKLKYPTFDKSPSKFWRVMGAASFVLFPAAVAIILAIGILILRSIFAHLPCGVIPFLHNIRDTWSACTDDPTAREAAWRTFAFFVYLWTVYLLVTRF